MDQQIASRLEADLFLLHAPSVYDFREHDDMLFAYLSDSVNVTSVYEMHPSAGSRSSNGWRTTGLTRKP